MITNLRKSCYFMPGSLGFASHGIFNFDLNHHSFRSTSRNNTTPPITAAIIVVKNRHNTA